jgi:hypothetical protein
MNPKRPLRDITENLTDNIPGGPLGITGGGNLVGGTGYFVVSAINGVVPLDGVDVGFDVESHSVERQDDREIHTFIIHSSSKDVAQFIAKYRSSPSNVQFLGRDIQITDVREEKSNRSFSRWRVTTEVESRGGTTDVTEL